MVRKFLGAIFAIIARAIERLITQISAAIRDEHKELVEWTIDGQVSILLCLVPEQLMRLGKQSVAMLIAVLVVFSSFAQAQVSGEGLLLVAGLLAILGMGAAAVWLLKSPTEMATPQPSFVALLFCLALFLGAGSTGAFAQTQPNLENGFKRYGSHDGSNLDTVNLMSGNWMLHAGLIPDIPQRAGLTNHYFLDTNSKNWQVRCISSQAPSGQTCFWQPGGTGVGFERSDAFSMHRTLIISYSSAGTTYEGLGYTLNGPDGTTHQMYGIPGTEDANGDATVYESLDTTGYRISLSSQDSLGVFAAVVLTDRQGNQYTGGFGAYQNCPRPQRNMIAAPGGHAPIIDDAPMGDRYCSQSAFLTQVTDAHGNQMSFRAGSGADTLGRSLPFASGGTATTDYSGCVSRLAINSAVVYSYTGPGGVTQQIKMCIALFPFQTAFNATSGSTPVSEAQNYSTNYSSLYGGYVGLQIVTVILADGSKWTFDYDNYLEVTSVGLPTGGSINLTWTTISFLNCNPLDHTSMSRAVATRTVNDNNGHSSTWTYNWGAPSSGTLINQVTDPLSNDTIHTFTDQGGCAYYETRTQSYQGTGSSRQLQKQVDTTYASTPFSVFTSVGTAVGNVVPTSIKTTIYPSGKVSLVAKTYDTGLGTNAPIFGNVVSEKVYDWGPGVPGALLRETDTSYIWQSDAHYLTAHLLDLPASVVVKDGNGNRVAETDYAYDESQYLTAANINTQHVAASNAVRGNLTTVSRWLNPGNSMISSHTNWYDTGEVYQQIDPLGNTTTHSYDTAYAGAYSTKTQDALGHVVSGTYDFSTGLLSSFTNANATSQASGNTPGDAAHTTNYVYDVMSRVTSATLPADPLGNHPQTAFNYPNLTTVELLRKITGSLTEDAFTYSDGLGRTIQSKHVIPGGNALVDTTYDGLDRAASVSNPYFSTSELTYGVTQSQYDALGRVIQTTKQDGGISTVSYSDNCTTTTDEAGKQRRACTDALGRLASVDEPGDSTAGASPVANGGGNPATATVSISGSEQSKQTPPTPGGPPPLCSPGQLCDGGGGGGGTTNYIYDSGTVAISLGGRVYSTAYNAADDSASMAAHLAAAINGDGLGVATASASGGTIGLQSRATGSQVSFALSYSWKWDTADFPNPSFTASGPSGLSGGTDGPAVFGGHAYATLYSYDALANLVQVTQQGGSSDQTKWRVRRFTYDSLSRLLTANNPESGLITYFYDANGNLTQKVMPSPNQTGAATHSISYAYDALNRVTGKAYSWQNSQNGQLPQGTAVVSYRYDEGTNGIGHLTSLTDQAGSATYSYDILGRMVSESRTIAGMKKSMSYTYNLDGSVATMAYPSGAVITYTPDAAGRMLSAVDTTNSSNPINYVTGATYNATGALTGSIYGQNSSFSGIVNSFSFNNRLQPVNLWSSSPTRTLMNLVYDFHVGNGDNGNVYGITNNRDSSRSQTFTYDPLNRLLSAQNAGADCNAKLPDGHTEYWGNSYVYDAWGNLNQKQVTKCAAENLSVTVAANNQLLGGTYVYDSAGNMMRDNNGTNYAYDAENRIGSTTGFNYSYDADGNRVEKVNGANGTGTLYWYMTPGVVAESDLSGNLQSEYVFFDGERVARKDLPSNTVSYYFSDHLKTASVITDAVGTIKSESDYYPWGGELQFLANDSNHYKFTGKERDVETGLDYFGARHYSNGLGRFITPDWAATPEPVPYADLTDPQSLNQYTYVRNVPTSRVDADGHETLLSRKGEEEFGKRMDKVDAFVVRALNHPAVQGYLELFLLKFGGAAEGGAAGSAAKGAEEGAAAGGARGTTEGVGSNITANAEKGAASESKVLNDLGKTKNTEAVVGKEGKSIPDFKDSKVIGEIKDAKTVSNTKQLRIQKDAAQQSGRQHHLHTGTKTHVTQPAAQGTTVIRRDDLGPK
jgi:RHS repeat-associated protein